MTRAQRIVVVTYCLAVVCCCVSVPSHYQLPNSNLGVRYTVWLWSADGMTIGTYDTTTIVLRLLAATALCAAAFLLARSWKVLLVATGVASLGVTGIVTYTYVTNQRAIARDIHDCALAKVAALPPEFQVCEPNGSCTPTTPSDDEILQKNAQRLATAQRECAAQVGADPH